MSENGVLCLIAIIISSEPKSLVAANIRLKIASINRNWDEVQMEFDVK